MFECEVFRKTNGNVVKITMNEFRGLVYTHIREYQMDGDTGFWYPTKTGYAFDAGEIDSVIEGLELASETYAKYSRFIEYDENQLEFDLKGDTDE
jgi:hypothetical protein